MSHGADDGDAFPVEHEEHESHERYLITYADMITLLMALFIILFAVGQTDLEKYKSFAAGASEAFGGDGVLEGGPGINDQVAIVTPVSDVDTTTATAPGHAPGTIVGTETQQQLAEELARVLQGQGLPADAVTIEHRGVVIQLAADNITFEPGSWTLLPQGQQVVADLAKHLLGIPNPVLIEGHTDDVPMAGPLTNWELSTNRAGAVVRALEAAGIPAIRLSAAGYGETHPVASNADAVGRSRNRRVEVVVTTE